MVVWSFIIRDADWSGSSQPLVENAGENVHLILVIMSYTDEKSVLGVALFIDFRKPFDTVEWDFLIDTLNKLNFGSNVN